MFCLSSIIDIYYLLSLLNAWALSWAWKNLAGAGFLWHILELFSPWSVIFSLYLDQNKDKQTHIKFKIILSFQNLLSKALPNLLTELCNKYPFQTFYYIVNDLVYLYHLLNYAHISQLFVFTSLSMQFLPPRMLSPNSCLSFLFLHISHLSWCSLNGTIFMKPFPIDPK